MKTFNEWKQDQAEEASSTAKVLLVFMLVAFIVAALAA